MSAPSNIFSIDAFLGAHYTWSWIHFFFLSHLLQQAVQRGFQCVWKTFSIRLKDLQISAVKVSWGSSLMWAPHIYPGFLFSLRAVLHDVSSSLLSFYPAVILRLSCLVLQPQKGKSFNKCMGCRRWYAFFLKQNLQQKKCTLLLL